MSKTAFNIQQINSIVILTRAYYDYQRDFLSLINQLGEKKNGDIKKGSKLKEDSYVSILIQRRKELEICLEQIEKQIQILIHLHPLWKTFLEDVKGCGEMMAAVIISQFDINKAPTVSNLWSFAGLAPGKDRKVKGQKCTFNQFLRAKLCGVLGSSFLKCQSPYSEYYYNMKNRLDNENWGMESKNPVDKNKPKAGHQHKAATRYMIKMFLKDLYVAWRTIENLPIREPYQVEYLGKQHTA